ncbi:MAG: NfeD family protein [Firmicutes bacterium]|nr:NfeD family protein [Bacillota bacterium]
MELWVIWLVIIIALVFLEAITVGLVSIWFIASAVVALILSFFTSNFYIQFAVFAILGIILLITTRPILTKIMIPKKTKTNLDRVIGMTGIVTEEISKNNIGEVKVDGKRWSAKANEKINVGEAVNIRSIDGVKLIVEKEGI